MILEEELSVPSIRLSTLYIDCLTAVARNPSISVGVLRRELDWINMRALEKARSIVALSGAKLF